MPSPGDTLVKRISLMDGVGAPIVGASFNTDALDPAGSVLVPNAETYLGDGIYEFSIPTSLSDPVGQYYLRISAVTVPVQVFEAEWLVKPVGSSSRWQPGDTVIDHITVIDPLGDPVTGDSFTISSRNTVGNPMIVSAPTEVAPGVYRVEVKTSRFDPPGSYYIQLRSSSLPLQVYEVEFTTGQPVNLIGGTTLRTLRRRVIARFGDLVSARATVPSDGSIFADEDNLYGEPGRYAGREVLMINGLNAGELRQVIGSSRNDSSLTFNRSLPFPVSVGDECDITNAYGIGITFRAVRDAIDYAIETARTMALQPVSYTILQWNGEAIPIPATVVGISDVYGIDRDSLQRHVPRGNNRDNGWRIDPYTRTIVLGGQEGRQSIGLDLVVNARVLPSLLVDDDDVTHLDLAWLVDTAASHLCLDSHLSRQSGNDWANKGMLYAQNAERRITALTPNLGPNYQAVK